MTVFSIERRFELCWWDVADETVEAILVVPMDPAEGCKLQLFKGFSRPRMVWSADEFRLVIPVHGLRESIIETVAYAPNGGDGANLLKALAITNGRELSEFNRSLQHLLVELTIVVH